MVQRLLGATGATVSPIAFGAFKIGRNVGIKYPRAYELPGEGEVESFLNGVLDLGINLIDTAPAYGTSEERIGQAISHRRDEFIIATKVGETFEGGKSTFDFTAPAVRKSVDRSRLRIRADFLDLVTIHSSGEDLAIINETDAVDTLRQLRDEGVLRWIGFSGKTVPGARAALGFADVIMVEYHIDDCSHEPIIAEAREAGVGVLVKKGLASGRLPAEDAIRFVLSNRGVASMVVGSLNLDHLRRNVDIASGLRD